ncbi:MAG: mercury(II) reductase [Thiohalospira sp.]
MSERRLRISGMTCSSCAEHVQRALEALGDVTATVRYPAGTAWVSAPAEMASERLVEAVRASGYGAEMAAEQAGTGAKGRGCGLHVAVVGGGSAAFAGAIRAADEGARVTLIERGILGGTCVNVGCVPSKIRLKAAEAAHRPGHHPFAGVAHRRPEVDLPAMVQQQQDQVAGLRRAKYQDILEARPEITHMSGTARFEDAATLRVTGPEGEGTRVTPDRILVATGSRPAIPWIPGLAESPYWTSTEALVAEALPGHLLVLGGGYIGCELAQAFARLGSQVTIVPRRGLLAGHDPELGAVLESVYREEGIRVRTGTEVRRVRYEGGFALETTDGDTLEGDRLLVATGRSPNTEDLGLEEAGIVTDGSGAIQVDRRLATSSPNVFAAGDCTSQPRLVYVAAAAGTRAAANMLGGEEPLDLSRVPQVVFTDPQVATVGLTEREAADRGMGVTSRTLPLDYVPRALANFDTRGMVKLVAEEASGRVVGAQIAAEGAGEVVQSAALAMEAGLTVGQLGDRLFPYLTMAEGLKLCAQTFTRDVTELSCCAG